MKLVPWLAFTSACFSSCCQSQVAARTSEERQFTLDTDVPLREMAVMVATYYDVMGHSPTSVAELLRVVRAKLVSLPRTLRISEEEEVFVDPWNRPFVFRCSKRRVLIYSCGPNGSFEEGEGDESVIIVRQ
jgi:hypothetical protein